MKKRLYLISLLVGLVISAFAQKQVQQYEYWFDDNYVAKAATNITPASTFALNTTVPTTGLPAGLHSFQIRFKETSGLWSATSTQFFVKQPNTTTGQNQVTQYEYWFDTNYSNKTQQSVSTETEISLSSTVLTSQLPVGLHSFQIRFKDNTGKWSPTNTQFFVKQPSATTEQTKIVKYECWFDSNYSGKTTQSVASQQQISLISSITTENLPVGLHSFQIRFQQSSGSWSATTTQFFVKQPSTTSEQTKIVKYEYWFDTDYSKKTGQSVSSQKDLSLVSSLATNSLPVGLHTFQIRFQETTGAWSSTTTQFFIKPNLANMGDNKISAYEYWYNDSISNRKYVTVNPVNPLELKQILLPVNSLNNKITPANIVSVKDANGNYQYATKNTLHIRFKDTRGAWSSVSDSTFAAILNDGNIDLSSFIINPDATNGKTGWTSSGSVTNQSTGHWTGTTNPYFYFGNTGSNWTSSITQTISGLPAGTYTLSAAGRSTTDTKMTMSVAGVSVDFPSNGAVGGEIWEDALTGTAEKNCNNGTGFGWSRRGITFTTDGSPVIIAVNGTATKINQWCNIDNFTLTVNNSASLDVSLPETVNAASFKGNKLQLINKTTGAKISLTTTGKQTYSFNGLLPFNVYNVALLTTKGAIMADIDSIRLSRGINSVKFTDIKNSVSVKIQVNTPSKIDVTKDVTIQWYNTNNQYLAQDDSLPGMTFGTAIYYTVTLNKTLGSQFIEPDKQPYTVTTGRNNLVCTLQPIDSVTITGIVKDENKWVMSGASVAISQLLNGTCAKSFTAQTDKNGKYSLTVYNDSSTVTISSQGYISQSRTYTNFKDSTNLGTIILKPITGVTVATNFTYTPSVAEGETATTESYYSNYQNVVYQLYNVTKNKAIGEVYVQYPNLIIQDKTDVGDQIRITVTSRVGEFSPTQCIVIVNQNSKDTANFNLKELGAIKATYTDSYNGSNVGILYNAQGQFIKKENYFNTMLMLSGLADGNYTLVSMANSTFFNSVLNLSELTTSGLTSGTDYTLNNMVVKSGVISTVSVSSIPLLNESKFYYTGSNTIFSVNKTSIVAGNYVTLRSKLDFKSEYAGKVNNVNLIVDIPDNCSFVNNSVMIGTAIAAYVRDGNQIIIPLNGNYTDQIRFCITPTIGGTYTPSAFVKFDSNNKTVTQPIGSASFTATDMSITVPNQTAKKTNPISGTAPAFSTVSIYDGTTLIGQTTAFATGTWMTSCELFEAYNLTTHEISAKIHTPAGITIQTETQKVEYNISLVEVKTVTMINTAHGPESLNLKEYNTVFDFQHPSATMPPYWYWPSYPDFTFKIDFTNNDTAYVSNVKLYVKTSSNEIVPISATYDKVKDIWVATRKFNSSSLPVNLSVGYNKNKSENLVDREYINDSYNGLNSFLSESISEKKFADSLFDIENVYIDKRPYEKLDSLLLSGNYDSLLLNIYINEITEGIPFTGDTISSEQITLDEDKLTKEFNDWKNNSYFTEKKHILDTFYPTDEFLNFQMPTGNAEWVVSIGSKNITYSQTLLTNIIKQDLIDQGYYYNDITDSSKIFYKYATDSIIYIDTYKKLKYSIITSETNNVVNQQKMRSVSLTSFTKCADDIINLSAKLLVLKKELKDADISNPKSIISLSKEILNVLESTLSSSICYYEGLRNDCEIKLKNTYKNEVEKLNNYILSRKDLIDKKVQYINIYKVKLLKENADLAELNKEISELEKELLNDDLASEIRDELKNSISNKKNEVSIKSTNIKSIDELITKQSDGLLIIQKQKSAFEMMKLGTDETFRTAQKALDNIPLKLTKDVKINKWVNTAAKLGGIFGTIVQVASIGIDAWDATDEIKEWIDLQNAIEVKMPCENDASNAQKLEDNIFVDSRNLVVEYVSIIGAEIGATILDTDASIPFVTPQWYISSSLDIYAEWSKWKVIENFINKRGNYWVDIMNLKCNKCKTPPCPDPDPNPNPNPENGGSGGNGGGASGNSGSGNVPWVQDPSGYVYEAVSKNRLEGVTATIYCKTKEEDMYGDKHDVITKWDATPYLQINPLVTDVNGVYAWDVPEGLWRVKYEKAGYETMYSDWLPVPPPQLDINVGMQHSIPPTVKKIQGYEEGINIRFDKYMKPATMTTKEIVVNHNGLDVSGTIRMLNEEEGYATDTAKYVSKVRFVPSQAFTAGDKVTVTVKSTVLSYAGMKMASDYTQTVDIEKEVKAIAADSLAEMKIHGNRTIAVTVTPAAAAKGKMLLANSASSSIVSLTSTQAVLDDNGKATFNVNGDLPGGTTVQFTMVDVDDVSAVTKVNVSMTTQVTAPFASIASGAIVPKDTTVTLYASTSGATIYYTTDGTLPFDVNGSRKVYTEPIKISQGMTIKAIAVKAGFDDSNVTQFSYIISEAQSVKDVKSIMSQLKMYPNPASINQKIILEINALEVELQRAQLSVSSIDGRILQQNNNVRQKMILSGLNKGCFIVQIRLNNGKLLRNKLVIN